MTIICERIYGNQSNEGMRILVDRVWPRGISKSQANLDKWLKSVAPTTSLRKWFDHDPKLFEAFKHKYVKELEENTDQHQAFNELKNIVNQSKTDVILLYGAKDTTYNHVNILKELLEK
ncbi:DUF488 family protein [Staphylococcus warneri]|uniref:DUF488 domain-containing protein n=1 Tax=Staphylococcus warneri TaxID=1292 RepID=UPI003260289D